MPGGQEGSVDQEGSAGVLQAGLGLGNLLVGAHAFIFENGECQS